MTSQVDLEGLQTEERNPRSVDIDIVPTLKLCQIINDEDVTVPNVVQKCIPVIADAIDALTERVRTGGRLLYVGAGTSGRLGVLDASEIPPTFSAPPSQFVALIAGGDVALRSAREGAEDSLEGAVQDLDALQLQGEKDSLIGIAASGRTPYVLSCLAFAKSKGCVTVGIACSAPSAMSNSGHVDFMINAVTGPEVVTGSTRMKAGTATKLVLNMLSTGVMIKTGKTFGNIMIDVKPTNVKLQIRARRILRAICGDRCPESNEEIGELLRSCDRSVKLAAAMAVLGIPIEEARIRLNEVGGVLAKLMVATKPTSSDVEVLSTGAKPKYVLCVDGGGSKCQAVIRDNAGMEMIGEAGPCNPSDIGVEAAVVSVELAVQRALDSSPTCRGLNIQDIHLSNSWIGLAGFDRESLRGPTQLRLGKILGEKPQTVVKMTNDIELLATVIGHRCGVHNVVVLVTGTGSIAMRFKRDGAKFSKVARAGGWGALLGDDGSGFDVGRSAIRATLRYLDRRAISGNADNVSEPQDPLPGLILSHYRRETADAEQYDLLSSVLLAESQDAQSMSQTKRRIASCAKVVVESVSSSDLARSIILSSVQRLSELVTSIYMDKTFNAADSVLALAGGLMQSQTLRRDLIVELSSAGAKPGRVEVVDQPAVMGAEFLAERAWGYKYSHEKS